MNQCFNSEFLASLGVLSVIAHISLLFMFKSCNVRISLENREYDDVVIETDEDETEESNDTETKENVVNKSTYFTYFT